MDKEKEFLKNIKVKKTSLIFALIILVTCIGLEAWACLYMKNKLDNPIELGDITKEGEYTCVDVESMTDYFATYGTEKKSNEKIYFLFDEKYMYTANLNEKNLEKLKPIMDYSYSEEEEPEKREPVRICGVSNLIPSKLKTLTIDSYNEMVGEKFLTSTNFENYITNYYIDTDENPAEDLIWQSVIIGIFAFVGIIAIFTYFKNSKMTKRTLSQYENEMDRIKSDACAPDTTYVKNAKIYLTKDYIINFANGFEIYNYKDIIWIYPYELRQNGYVTQKSIYIVTNDSKVHIVASLGTSQKNNTAFDELYQTLLMKVPNALHGYSKENLQKSKEMYKK